MSMRIEASREADCDVCPKWSIEPMRVTYRVTLCMHKVVWPDSGTHVTIPAHSVALIRSITSTAVKEQADPCVMGKPICRVTLLNPSSANDEALGGSA